MNLENPLTVRRISAIKAALADGVMNAHQLAPLIGLCFERTEDYLEVMHKQGDIHIKEWKAPPTGKQQRIQHYKLGKGRDAPRPAPYTVAERMALRRARIRKDLDRYDAMLARDRVQKHLRRMSKQPRSWFAALEVRP